MKQKKWFVFSILIILSFSVLCMSCNKENKKNTDKTSQKSEQKKQDKKKSKNDSKENKSSAILYQTTIYWKGNFYHWAKTCTIVEPKEEIGTVETSVDSMNKLPKKEFETNNSYYIGKKLYYNPEEKEACIYVLEEQKEYEKLPVYDKFEKGIQRDGGVVDSNYPCIRYQEKIYLLEEKKVKKIKKKFQDVGEITAWYSGVPPENFATNSQGILGCHIYAAEDDSKVIYVDGAEDGTYFEWVEDRSEQNEAL